MSDEATKGLDVSDLTRRMGVPIMPGQLKEPVSVSDLRRWVQAMHYPNPPHFDEGWAAESRFGGFVAPQSFTVATDTSHGAAPSTSISVVSASPCSAQPPSAIRYAQRPKGSKAARNTANRMD